jgi:hypothetical protein
LGTTPRTNESIVERGVEFTECFQRPSWRDTCVAQSDELRQTAPTAAPTFWYRAMCILPPLARSMAVVVALLSVASTTALANPITPPSAASASAMVANLIGNNSGIVVTPGSEVYTGATIASGLFTGADGILPFASGVVLTSGSAALVPGPNNNQEATAENGTASDPYLNSLMAGTIFGDAATLEFRFTTTGNAISFQYVFGSEEYPEWVSLVYNDVFGFFLDGVNIALIPNTTTPISIDTVNAGLNSQYYRNNPPSDLNIQYDGLVGVSVPLFASAAITPNVEHRIMFGVEDAGDLIMDSGVMLASGSFVATGLPEPTPEPIPEPATLLTSASGLVVLARYMRRRGRAA